MEENGVKTRGELWGEGVEHRWKGRMAGRVESCDGVVEVVAKGE